MNKSTRYLSYLFHTLIYTVVSVLVIAAILLSLVRILLPTIEEYKVEVEGWVSAYVGKKVEIATMDAAWYGFEPQLVLKGVQLLSDDETESIAVFQQARLGINLFASLYSGVITPGAFILEGASFVVERNVDGHISVRGINQSASTTAVDQNGLLESWLLNQRVLEVRDSEIIWQDFTAKRKARRQFTNVNLRLINDGERHAIDGSVSLPESLGTQMRVAMDAQGNFLSAKGWSGNIYIDAANLKLAEWLEGKSWLDAAVTNGGFDGQIWSQWRGGELISLKGHMQAQNVQLFSKLNSNLHYINQFSGNFSLLNAHGIWELTLNDIVVMESGRMWPDYRLDIRLNEEKQLLEASLPNLNLEVVTPFLDFLYGDRDDLLGNINQMKIKGSVSNLQLRVHQYNTDPEFFLGGNLHGFSNQAWEKIPGLNWLNAEFELSNEALRVVLNDQNITLDLPRYYAQKSRLEKVSAKLLAVFSNQQMRLIANDINFRFRNVTAVGSLDYLQEEPDKLGHLDLAFFLRNGKVADTRFYIPEKIMNPNLVAWLNRSLQSGKVDKGSLIFNGNLVDYPFLQNQGIFKVDLSVADGKLQFSDQWPEIDSINGAMQIYSNAYYLQAENAITQGSKLENVDVALPEFRAEQPAVSIMGKVLGESQNILNYLHNSPLENTFASKLSPLEFEGESELDLVIKVPLKDLPATKAEGLLEIAENNIRAPEWKLDLHDVETKLRFNNKGIWANKILASLDEIPITGEIDTTDLEGDKKLLIYTTADINNLQSEKLLKRFVGNSEWSGYINGRSKYRARIDIPLKQSEENVDKKIVFNLASNLLGTEVKAPYPFLKPGNQEQKIDLSLDLTGVKRLLEIQYGDTNAKFEIVAQKDSLNFSRGGVAFQSAATLPDELGYRFSGKLPEFSWTEWQDFLFPKDRDDAVMAKDTGNTSLFFDVNIDQLDIFGQSFRNTGIQASRTAQLWTLHFVGNDIAGQVNIPVVFASSPMVMDMERLYIKAASTTNRTSPFSPVKMPELQIDVKDFRYESINYGTLKLRATKIETGLRLSEFRMQSPRTVISGTGDWLETADVQKSAFNIDINTTDLGKTTRNWGYEEALSGGKGSIVINASWPGMPSDFSFKTASGDMNVSVDDVSLKDFDLGAAKMFGLFLPRRLLLDFRDVFKSGMHFDTIRGKYHIDEGNAFTNKLMLNGPVADIKMEGRIGLVARDYDQVVTINRRIVGDSIPVLAAIATAQPLIAAQIYIFQKMFAQQIDDILSIQYTIEGPWQDPVITPVVKNAQTGEDLGTDFLGEQN